jgi:hypothetical protein
MENGGRRSGTEERKRKLDEGWNIFKTIIKLRNFYFLKI